MTPQNSLAPLAKRAADELIAEIATSSTVLIATVDGFDLAHAGNRAVDPARLAAMVSSFAALGDAASRETGIGAPRCLVIESTEGRLVVRCFQAQGQSIVVVLLTDKSVLLGLAWNHLAALEQRMNAA